METARTIVVYAAQAAAFAIGLLALGEFLFDTPAEDSWIVAILAGATYAYLMYKRKQRDYSLFSFRQGRQASSGRNSDEV